MRDETYNGWTNRATWLVALHLNNDQYLQGLSLETAEREYRDAIGTHPFDDDQESAVLVDRYAVSMAGDALFELVDELTDVTHEGGLVTASLLRQDLIGQALAQVDWMEVAEAFLEDVERVTDQEVPA